MPEWGLDFWPQITQIKERKSQFPEPGSDHFFNQLLSRAGVRPLFNDVAQLWHFHI
jgi:hypothetical protein